MPRDRRGRYDSASPNTIRNHCQIKPIQEDKGVVLSITVYSKDRCPQCEMTKRRLNRRGVDFDEVNLSHDPRQLEELVSMGFQSAPVVIVEDNSTGETVDAWAGFQVNRIDRWADRMRDGE